MTTEVTARCVVCTGDKAATVGLLCSGHFQNLGVMLRDVEEQAAILSAVPSMQQRVGSGKGSLASERAPARLDVIVHTDVRSKPAGVRYPGPACPSCWHGSCTDIRSWLDAYDARATDTLSILDVLHSWARIVREERQYSDQRAITVSGERDVLVRHLEWVAGQMWVDECYSDLRQLVGQLKAANGHRADRPLTRCVLPAEGGLCGGNVWEQEALQVATYADGSSWTVSVPGGPAVCDQCGATWATAEDKARLRLMIEQEHDERTRPRTEDGRPMLTAQELVDQGHVSSVSNVRVQAHRRGKVSVDGHYDPQWFAERMTG